MNYKVFVTSTTSDLYEYREATRQAIEALGMRPVMWEQYKNRVLGQRPLQATQQRLKKCDIAIGIYAHHYGNIPDIVASGEPNVAQKSYIELEYDSICDLGIQFFPFLLSTDVTWPENFINTGEAASRLQKFKSSISTRFIFNSFSTPDDLYKKVLIALGNRLIPPPQTISVRPTHGYPSSSPQFRSDIFMIMPFQHNFNAIYESTVRLAAEELNLSIKRGDQFHSHQGDIIKEIYNALYACKMVVVECTPVDGHLNGNVYYELGIADTLGKPAVLITQNINAIPFDLRQRRFIAYDDTPSGLKTLYASLKTALERFVEQIEEAELNDID